MISIRMTCNYGVIAVDHTCAKKTGRNPRPVELSDHSCLMILSYKDEGTGKVSLALSFLRVLNTLMIPPGMISASAQYQAGSDTKPSFITMPANNTHNDNICASTETFLGFLSMTIIFFVQQIHFTEQRRRTMAGPASLSKGLEAGIIVKVNAEWNKFRERPGIYVTQVTR